MYRHASRLTAVLVMAINGTGWLIHSLSRIALELGKEQPGTDWARGGGLPQRDVARRRPAGKPSFRDLGWVWEGQGIDPKVPPSIYGLGQGARYFGLSRVNYLFHPNDEHG